jgi:hypothetical protein
MTCGYIYKIVFPNGKHYIGLTTTSLEQRTKEHKYRAKGGDTKCLYNALRKYEMVDTFELIEIDTADTLEELCEKEIGYIIEYNSYGGDGSGYNMTRGGEGTVGYIHTEENNQKNSERVKKYYEDNPEAGKEQGERMKKYYEDNPEAREKCSEIKKKYFEEHPEAIEEVREKSKKHWSNPEARKDKSEKQKKYYDEHPEARQQMKEKTKKYYDEHPEARRKSSGGEHKPFDVFTIDGTFIKTFTYQFEAKEYLQKEYNIRSTLRIDRVLNGNRQNCAGFVFKYK